MSSRDATRLLKRAISPGVSSGVRGLTLAALLLALGWSTETTAVCQIAPPQDSVDCFYDSSGQCCITLETRGEQTCAIGYCMDFTTCTWEAIIELGCS